MGFPDSSVGKESTCNAVDPGSIPGSGRSTREGTGYPLQYCWASLVAQMVKNPSPGEGNGYPLQYSGLENCMDCIVHGVTKNHTLLSNFHFDLNMYVSLFLDCFLLGDEWDIAYLSIAGI